MNLAYKTAPTINNVSDSQKYKIPDRGNYNFKSIPLDDPRVWSLFARGDTKGVFQLEKQLGQDWSRRIKPRSIDELSDLIALLRPGCLESGISDEYAKRKFGESEIIYLHPALEPILKDTYGCLVYQESAMQIAVELAGFNEVQADNLRKAIGKKKPEEMAKVKIMFMDGAKNNKIITEKEAEEIFGWIEKSVRYSFNRAHSVSYAYISYYSAYQKVHFSTEFYVSWLTYSDWKPSPKEEIAELVQNAKMNNITILPPSIMEQNADFKKSGDREITFGLQHIRGVGESAIKKLEEYKNELVDFPSFLKYVPKIKKNVAESLIKSGACDCYNIPRIQMLNTLYVIYGQSKESSRIELKSLSPVEIAYVLDTVDVMGLENCLESIIDNEICVKRRMPAIIAKLALLKEQKKDTARQNSIWEKIYLGLNLTCSAADDVAKIDKNLKTCRQVYQSFDKEFGLHVVIDAIRYKETSEKAKNPGQKYCYLSVSDNSGALTNMICWPEQFEQYAEMLYPDNVVTIYGRKDNWKNKQQLVVTKMVQV